MSRFVCKGIRYCGACKQEKPEIEFYLHLTGFSSRCKSCKAKYQREGKMKARISITEISHAGDVLRVKAQGSFYGAPKYQPYSAFLLELLPREQKKLRVGQELTISIRRHK